MNNIFHHKESSKQLESLPILEKLTYRMFVRVLLILQKQKNDYESVSNFINSRAIGDFPETLSKPELNIKVIEYLAEQLLEFSEGFRLYLSAFVDHMDSKRLDLMNGFSENDRIISLNYTFTMMVDEMQNYFYYENQDKYLHHIHGNDEKEYGIVLGVNDVPRNNTTLYCRFQKWFQRIVKQTGSQYLNFFETDDQLKCVIYGWSLNLIDSDLVKDIFMHVLKTENGEILIYYYREFDPIVINLATIFGKDDVIKWTGEKRITFVSCENVKTVS